MVWWLQCLPTRPRLIGHCCHHCAQANTPTSLFFFSLKNYPASVIFSFNYNRIAWRNIFNCDLLLLIFLYILFVQRNIQKKYTNIFLYYSANGFYFYHINNKYHNGGCIVFAIVVHHGHTKTKQRERERGKQNNNEEKSGKTMKQKNEEKLENNFPKFCPIWIMLNSFW